MNFISSGKLTLAILLFVNQCSMIVISLIFVQKSEHAHSTAPPLQTRPTALGSGLGLTVHEMACASFSATKGKERHAVKRVFLFLFYGGGRALYRLFFAAKIKEVGRGSLRSEYAAPGRTP